MEREEIKTKTIEVIANLRGIEPTTIHEDLILESDLGMDSLDMIETIMALENIFNMGVPDDEVLRKEMSLREFINHIEIIINETRKG